LDSSQAQYLYGDSGISNDRKAILWLDLSLDQSGQAFFQKHYASIMFAHAPYFGLGFGFKPITALVIKSQSFHGKFQTTEATPVHHMARSPLVRAGSHRSPVGGL